MSPATEFKSGPQQREQSLRARMMARRTRKDTKIERLMQQAMKDGGMDFEPNKKILGRCEPDLVIADQKIAVFCDGDYWHRRPEVAERDARINADLGNAGWTAFRFWEHDILEDVGRCAAAVGEAIIPTGGGLS